MIVEKKAHDKTLDIAKGIAILCVVLGHSFPSNIFTGETGLDYAAKLIYDFVYSFHMPVFFFISGYLFNNAWINHRAGTVKRKAQRLLIPYITFSILYIPLRLVASGMANSDFKGGYWQIAFGVSPNGGVWFLYTLFLFFVMTFYLVNNSNIKIVLIVSVCVSVISQIGLPFSQTLHDVAPRILDIFRFYIYFILGLYIREITQKKTRFEKIFFSNGIIKTMLFVILFSLYDLFALKIFCVPVALLGVNLTLITSKKLYSDILDYLGRISIDIYLLYGPIMVVLRWIFIRLAVTKVLIPIGMFSLSLILAVLISRYIIHKIEIVEVLCTGNKG